MNTNIPEALKYLRAKKGITQADLAKALGVGKSTISMYEVGAREPDFEMLENIADYFNVDMMFLVRPNAAAQEKAPTLTKKDERITAQNEDEEDMLLLARHMEPIPEKDRQELKDQFRKSIDLYLRAKGLNPQEDE